MNKALYIAKSEMVKPNVISTVNRAVYLVGSGAVKTKVDGTMNDQVVNKKMHKKTTRKCMM